MFVGEDYNVESSVSDELFPNERSAVQGCVFNVTPEDSTNILDPATNLLSGTASTTASPSKLNGRNLLAATAASPFAGMSNVAYHPYSDFACHHMGSTLADGISQGVAGPDQFRTAPLWGRKDETVSPSFENANPQVAPTKAQLNGTDSISTSPLPIQSQKGPPEIGVCPAYLHRPQSLFADLFIHPCATRHEPVTPP